MSIIQKTKVPSRLLDGVLRHRWVPVLAAVVIIGIVWLAGRALRSESGQEQLGSTVPVKRGPLRISVVESGTIKNRDLVVVKSQVEGRTTILSLIPEGTYVKKDELLIELDSSDMEDQKARQQITVLNAEASYIRARENLAVTRSQGESDVAEAQLDCEFADLDLEKYLKGEYPQKVNELNADITIAEQELTQAQEKLDWSEKLAKAGYITASELKSDGLDKTRKELKVELARGDLDLLENYTKRRDEQRLKSDVEQAAKAQERVERKVNADNIQADADLKAKEAEYKRQQAILEKFNDQIAKCKITAPVGGMVVYATTGQGNWRGNVEPLDEGQEVRERQELIHLPTTSSMMAEVKVHESSLRKVRTGMPVIITTDALPGKVLHGQVGKIGLLPDAAMAWLNPDLKVYSTEIYLNGDGSDIRPGMTCRAEIIVEDHKDALYVPVQSILRVGSVPMAYVMGPNGPEQRAVELGLDNNRMVRIVSGLKEGEKILLAPPLAAASVAEESEISVPAMPKQAASDTEKPEQGQSDTGDIKFDPEKLPQLSDEDKRKLFENLTPEQREKMRQFRRQAENGTPSGSARPGTLNR